MQLSPEQIETLFAFTRKKYVHWYDLQAELVDHLASRIEEECSKDSTLRFEAALRNVYAGFGLFGFAHIVQEKESQLRRSSRKLWWRTFRAYFGLPHVVLVVASVVLLWQIAHLLPVLPALLIILVPYAYTQVRLLGLQRERRKMQRPLLLLELSPLRYTASFLAFQFLINSARWTPNGLFVLGILVLLCFLSDLAAMRAHLRVRAEAEALYPEAFAEA
ncbi:MAG: hypothetical protein EOP50_01620 [Sphingobacteriales bacterium]|nr:MAG: hypothetical protein EOP50_01620 [Sphingobacteriales bacterium]